MNCPACSETLTPLDLGGARVDACSDGCRGLWLGGQVMLKLAQGKAGAGQAFQEELLRATEGERTAPVDCPEGHGRLQARPHPRVAEVTIDVCRECGGIFLDPGELAAIRRGLGPTAMPMGKSRKDSYSVIEGVYDFIDHVAYTLL